MRINEEMAVVWDPTDDCIHIVPWSDRDPSDLTIYAAEDEEEARTYCDLYAPGQARSIQPQSLN